MENRQKPKRKIIRVNQKNKIKKIKSYKMKKIVITRRKTTQNKMRMIKTKNNLKHLKMKKQKVMFVSVVNHNSTRYHSKLMISTK